MKGLPEGATVDYRQTRGMKAPPSPVTLQRRQLSTQKTAYRQAVADRDRATAEFDATTVKLDTEEYVDRAWFEGLPKDQQTYLKAAGVDKFNTRQGQVTAAGKRLADFTKDGEIDVTAAVKAGKTDDLRLIGMSKQDIAKVQSFLSSHVEVQDKWVPVSYYQSLPPDRQQHLKAVGVEQFNKEIEEGNKQIEAQNAKLQDVQAKLTPYQAEKPGHYYHIQALADKAIELDDLVDTGFISGADKAATQAEAEKAQRISEALAKINTKAYRLGPDEYDIEKIMFDRAISPGDAVLLFGTTEEDRARLKEAILSAGKKKTAAIAKEHRPGVIWAQEIARGYLDWTLPGYGLQRHWSKMPTWNKAVAIAGDIALFIPIVGSLGKAGSSALKASTAAAKAAQAAGGATRAAKTITLGQRLANVGKSGIVLVEGVTEGGIRLGAGLGSLPVRIAFEPIRAVRGAASGMKQLVQVSVFPFRHPVDTAKGLGYVFGGSKALGDPIMTRLMSVTKVSVPLESGDQVIWRGLQVGERPVVGRSGNKIVLGRGAGKLAVPKLSEIRAGYEPVSAVETRIIATPQTLRDIGFSDEDIKAIFATLRSRAGFAGKRSPATSARFEITPIKTLSEEGQATVLESVIKQGTKVERVYGSGTIKPQLKPALREWRELNDWDVQTRMTAEETEAYAKALARDLIRTEGRGNVRVSKEHPTLVETRDPKTGEWHHAVDIHSYSWGMGEAAPEGAYGMLHNEPAVEITYPSKGRLRFLRRLTGTEDQLKMMSAAESGKRKAASILEWNNRRVIFDRGSIGPYSSDTDAIRDVAAGLKPVADMQDSAANRALARLKGLRVEPWEEGGFKLIYVHKDTAAGRQALANLKAVQATFNPNAPTSECLRYDIKMGEALGYKKADIQRFVMENYDANLVKTVAPEYHAPGIKRISNVGPPQHRLKDIIDYYVILETFKGKTAADKWARAFGFDPAELSKAAAESGGTFTWVWSPNAAGIKGSLPRTTLIAPKWLTSKAAMTKVMQSMMAPSKVSASASLPSRASLSPSAAASLSASIASPSLSRAASPSPSPSKAVSPSPSASPSAGSPSAGSASAGSPSTGSPSAGSPSRGSPSAGSPSAGSPYRSPSPSPGSPGVPLIAWLPKFKGTEKEARELVAGSVAFKMGELDGKGVWWILYPPDYGINAGAGEGPGKECWIHAQPPEGVKIETGPESAYRSVQALGGKVPETITGSVGWAKYTITNGKTIDFDSVLSPEIAKGSVAWRQGDLGYWVLYPPKYGVGAGPGEGEGKMFVKDKPKGVTEIEGPGSAAKTIQALGGKVPKRLSGSIGFQRYNVSHGKSIKFKPKRANRPRLSR